MRSKTKGNEHEQILLENVDREQTSDLMVDFFSIYVFENIIIMKYNVMKKKYELLSFVKSTE